MMLNTLGRTCSTITHARHPLPNRALTRMLLSLCICRSVGESLSTPRAICRWQ